MHMDSQLDIYKTLNRAKKELKTENEWQLYLTASRMLSVVSSDLFDQCRSIVDVLGSPDSEENLENLIVSTNTSGFSGHIPPLSRGSMKHFLQNMRLPTGMEIHSIELRPNETDRNFKRSGLQLRQYMVKGDVKMLTVDGIERGSPVSTQSNICPGDRLLAVGGFPLDHKTLKACKAGLLQSDRLKGLPSNANLYELATHLLDAPYASKRLDTSLDNEDNGGVEQGDDHCIVMVLGRIPDPQRVPFDQLLVQSPDMVAKKTVDTVLNANEAGIGIQIGLAKKIDDPDNEVIVIANIIPGGVAEADGTLKVGDQVIEINYESITKLKPKEAMKKIKSNCLGASVVQLKVLRPIYPPSQQQDVLCHTTENIEKSNGSTNVHDQVTAEQLDNQQSSTQPQRSPNADASALSPELCHVKALNYWQQQFGHESQILIADYAKDEKFFNLGINVEATEEKFSDIEDPEYRHYITGIEIDGAISLTNTFRVGDELLEITGNRLYNMAPLKVASCLLNSPTAGYLICARRLDDDSSDVQLSERSATLDAFSSREQFDHNHYHRDQSETGSSSIHSAQLVYAKPMHLSPASTPQPEDQSSDVDADPNQISRIITIRSTSFKKATGLMEASSDQGSCSLDSPSDLNYSTTSHRRQIDEIPMQDLNRNKTGLVKVIDCTRPNQVVDRKSRKQEAISETSLLVTPSRTGQDGGDSSTIASGSLPELTNQTATTTTTERLPMAPRIASLDLSELSSTKTTNKVIDWRKVKRLSQTMPDETGAGQFDLTYNESDRYYRLELFKKAGEFLGIELQHETGTGKGIRLHRITQDSQIDRLQSIRSRNKRWSSYSSQEEDIDEGSVHPFPSSGDWILAINDFRLSNQSEYNVTRYLNRLIRLSGTVSIDFIPKDEVPIYRPKRL